MKIEVLRESLHKAIATVLPAVASKSTLPVLSHILLSATDDGRLTLSATNLEVSIQTSVSARVETPGATTLPAKLLSDLIAGLPNMPITLELNDRNQETRIDAGAFKTTIKGIEADEFPTFTTTGEYIFEMSSADWRVVADQVATSASTEQGRPVLCGVHIFAKDGVTFEASDSYRLARKRFDRDMAGIDTLIPATALITARGVFANDADVSLSMANSDALVVLSDGNTILSSRVIDGRFPDIDRIIPQNYTTRIVVPASDLASRIKLAKYVAVSSSNIVRLDVAVLLDREGKLGIGANAAEVADLSDAIDVLATGKDTTIALNVIFLADAVGACGKGDIAIELQDGNRPAVLRAVGDDSMLQLLMPMTVR